MGEEGGHDMHPCYLDISEILLVSVVLLVQSHECYPVTIVYSMYQLMRKKDEIRATVCSGQKHLYSTAEGRGGGGLKLPSRKLPSALTNK